MWKEANTHGCEYLLLLLQTDPFSPDGGEGNTAAALCFPITVSVFSHQTSKNEMGTVKQHCYWQTGLEFFRKCRSMLLPTSHLSASYLSISQANSPCSDLPEPDGAAGQGIVQWCKEQGHQEPTRAWCNARGLQQSSGWSPVPIGLPVGIHRGVVEHAVVKWQSYTSKILWDHWLCSQLCPAESYSAQVMAFSVCCNLIWCCADAGGDNVPSISLLYRHAHCWSPAAEELQGQGSCPAETGREVHY